MGEKYDTEWALRRAVTVAKRSPCQKSKRGVVIWIPGEPHYYLGWNARLDADCDGSAECRAVCSKVCRHAEQSALLSMARSSHPWPPGRAHMLHVKVVDGEPVPSGPPSCWQCSKLIHGAMLVAMWLLHDDGLRSYEPREFHRLTLLHCGLARQEERHG